jgi:hypothetical protein
VTKALAVLALTLALLFVFSSAIGALSGMADEAQRHQEALHRLDEQRAAWQLAEDERQAQATQASRDAAANTWALLPACFGLLLVAAGGAALVGASNRAYRRRDLVWPRQDGLLPVPQGRLPAVAPTILDLFFQALIARAAGHSLPQRSPKLAELPAPAATIAISAPPFGSLLENGLIAPGRPLVLGYSAGQPLLGTWKDLYSSAVAGLPGSGKTTTLRFLAAQSALQGARFVILDPHADAGADSLAGTLAPLEPVFLAPPASADDAMLSALHGVEQELDARLAGGSVLYPLIVWVDEFTKLMGRSTVAGPLATLIEAIAQEGRKVQVFALLSGQIWNSDRAGGTALRESLASTYVHRMKPVQAQRLLAAEDARRARYLTTGHALLGRMSSEEVLEVGIPLTTQADIVRVATMLTGNVETMRRAEPEVIDRAARVPDFHASALLPTLPGLTEREVRVRDLLRAGVKFGDVVKQEWGVGGGRAYADASNELSAMIGKLIGG